MYNLLASTDLEQTISTVSLATVKVAAVLLFVLVLLTISLRDRVPQLKPWLFGALAATLLIPSLFLAASTVYLNVRSESGGPVHWHADFQIWACDTELNLRDPSGTLNNKVGTATLHEHNDKRIHLEGVAVDIDHDATVGKFMRVVGGEVSAKTLSLPLNDGDTTLLPAKVRNYISTGTTGPMFKAISGQKCGNKAAEVQAFAYRYNPTNNTYWQQKLKQPERWVIAPESQVPPGDCVVIEFDVPKDKTSRLCEQYGVRDEKRCEDFGVAADKRAQVCTIKEVAPPTGASDV